MAIEVIAGALVSSVVSGFVPVINGEAVAIVATLSVEPASRPLLLLACVAGHVAAKLCLFWLARRSPERLPARARAFVCRFNADRAPGASTLVVFSSAMIALPPLYPTTLAAGMVGVSALRFACSAAAGMTVRFSALIWGAGHFVG